MSDTVSVQSVNSRVRINLTQSSKGAVQMEITSEFPTVAEASDNLALAIDEVRAVLKEKGLVEAGAVTA